MWIDVAGQAVSLPVLVGLGLVAGVLAGMFGIGGGVFITPALNMVCGIPMPTAVSSSLCQQIGTSVGAFLKHRQHRSGEPWIDLYMLGGALMGAHAGMRTLHYLESLDTWAPLGKPVPAVDVVVQLAYMAFLVVAMVPQLRVLRRGTPPEPPGSRSDAPLRRLRIPPYVRLPNLGIRAMSMPVLAYVGFLPGFMSGMLGVGGGILVLPILINGLGIRLKDVVGTGIILLFANVVWGTALHAWAGTVHLPLALGVLAGSAIGTQVGARVTHRISVHTLSLCFVGLLFSTVAAILLDLWLSLS